MRVVLDTNLLVSSLLARHGNERRVLNLALNQKFTLLVSDAIMVEYEAVLSRPELKLAPDEVRAVLDAIRRIAERIQPQDTVTASPDEEDNRFLECVEAGDSEYLVTGNKRHFPATWGKARVVNARQFLELVSPEANRR